MYGLKPIFYSAVLHLSGRSSQIHFLSELRKRQFHSLEKTKRTHTEQLGKILHFAFQHVPYYRCLFQRTGITGNDCLNDPQRALLSLPLLDKQTLHAQQDALVTKDLASRRWYYNFSGGSTGEPVRFIQDVTYHNRSIAATRLFDEWTGFNLGESKLLLWGSERDLLVGKETWRSRMGRWIRNEYPLNTFRMSPADMYRFIATINRVKPALIVAYAESAYELSRFVEREKLTIHSPSAVMTSAGSLFPHMRRAIETVFEAPIFNRYGSREVGDIACECEAHNGLHVNPYTHHMEILRQDGGRCCAGEVGEVVITSLTNHAMPLLRYRIGDLAAWSGKSCDCGRRWPVLKDVSGRVTDVIVKSDGSKVMPEYFIHLIGVTRRSELDFIEKFQLIQEDFKEFRLLLKPNVDITTARDRVLEKRSLLQEIITTVMDDHCRLEVEVVEDIPKTPAGKYRYIISRITTPSK